MLHGYGTDKVPPSQEVREYTKLDLVRLQTGFPLERALAWAVMDNDYQDEIPAGHTAALMQDTTDADNIGVWGVVSPVDREATLVPAGSLVLLPDPNALVIPDDNDPHVTLGEFPPTVTGEVLDGEPDEF